MPLYNPPGSGAHPDLATHDTLGLATDAELTTHDADTTAVHGIADTSVLSTTAHDHDADYEAAGGIATHAADTTSVHGLADTTVLATDAEVATAVSDHSADTTAVHGIADTAAVSLTSHDHDADYDAIGAAAAAQAASQPVDSDLTAIAALTTTAFGRGLLALADAAALGANHTHAGGADPFQGSYAPGSFTVPTGDYAHIVQRLILTGTERVTLEGTAQLRLD